MLYTRTCYIILCILYIRIQEIYLYLPQETTVRMRYYLSFAKKKITSTHLNIHQLITSWIHWCHVDSLSPAQDGLPCTLPQLVKEVLAGGWPFQWWRYETIKPATKKKTKKNMTSSTYLALSSQQVFLWFCGTLFFLFDVQGFSPVTRAGRN